jgi:hypothetical protein
MSTQSLNLIVPMTLQLSATPQQAPNFSVGLVVSSSQSLKPTNWSAGQRTASYSGVAGAFTTDWTSDTPMMNFGNAYFGQTPAPVTLKVGLWLAGDANVTAAMTAIYNYDPGFYGVACEPATSSANVEAVAAFCQSNGLRFFFCDQEADCLTPGHTNTLAYLSAYSGAGGTSTPRACGIYTDAASDANGIGHAGLMALYMTTQYTQPNGLKAGMFKTIYGISPSALTQTQMGNICGPSSNIAGQVTGYNGNVYQTFGTTPMLAFGVASDGKWEDEGCALDWLLANLQTGIFNVMQQVPGKVPLTDVGTQMIIQGMLPTLAQARSNGLCAPGAWNYQGFGNISTGDILADGYYVYGAPVSTLTTAQRAARQAPAITIAMVGAGALQYVAPTIIFQR